MFGGFTGRPNITSISGGDNFAEKTSSSFMTSSTVDTTSAAYLLDEDTHEVDDEDDDELLPFALEEEEEEEVVVEEGGVLISSPLYTSGVSADNNNNNTDRNSNSIVMNSSSLSPILAQTSISFTTATTTPLSSPLSPLPLPDDFTTAINNVSASLDFSQLMKEADDTIITAGLNNDNEDGTR
eukprot:9668251-Ditylum_brightwellii.AAC.1